MGQRAGYSTYYRMREIGKGRTKYFETRMLFFWCWPPTPPLQLIDRTIRSFYRVFQKQVHSITMMYTYITLLHSEREIRRNCAIYWYFTFLKILWDTHCMQEGADKQTLRNSILRDYWNTAISFFERVSFNFIIVMQLIFLGGFLVHCD